MLFRLALIALIGGVLISVAVLESVEPAPASCGDADDHQRAGDLALAEDAYAAVLKDDSKADCAIDGLQNTRCRRARRALKADLPAEAGDRYLAVLKADPRATCAARGLADVATVRCNGARGLRDAGLLDEAVKAYTALLDVEPRPSCVPKQLKVTQDLKDTKPKEESSQPSQQPSSCCCCRQCGQSRGGCDG